MLIHAISTQIFRLCCLLGIIAVGSIAAGESATKIVLDGVSYSIPAPRISRNALSPTRQETKILHYARPFAEKIGDCRIITDISEVSALFSVRVKDYGDFCRIKYAIASRDGEPVGSGSDAKDIIITRLSEDKDKIVFSRSKSHDQGEVFQISAIALAGDRPLMLMISLGKMESRYEKEMTESATRWADELLRLNSPIPRIISAVRKDKTIDIPLPTGYERYVPDSGEGGYGVFLAFDSPTLLITDESHPHLLLARNPLVENKVISPAEFKDWKYRFKRDAVDELGEAEVVEESDKHLLYKTRSGAIERYVMTVFIKSRGLVLAMGRDPKAFPRVDPVKTLNGWRRDIYRLNREMMQ